MNFNQKEVDSIVRRAKELGAEEGCTHKNGHLKLEIYGKGPHAAATLASLIINGWHDKYDLIYATQAAIEHVSARREEKIREAMARLRRSHYYNDTDPWYSCPKCIEGCADESKGTDCNCGADLTNKVIDDLLDELFPTLQDNG